MDRRTLLLGAGAGVMGLGGYMLLRPQPDTMPMLPMAANAQSAEAATGEAPEVVEMVLGDPDAPVELIEYASFACPHCRTFHENVMPRLKADYIDTGLVRFVHREVYANRPSLWAAMVARCAGPDRYFAMLDLIYDSQDVLRGNSLADAHEAVRRIGRMAGMNDEQLDVCLTDAFKAQALIDRAAETAEEHDITGTPSFVIDGRTYSNMSYEELSAILDERIAAAQ